MTAKIAIAGYRGRMGQRLVQALESGAWPDLSFAAGTTQGDDPEMLLSGDVIIDFTTPEATRAHVALAAQHGKPIVIGTTGIDAAAMQEMKDAAAQCPLLYAANMSLGVNVLAVLVEQAGEWLGPDFDIQILETHHRHKVDAPSGTALMLGRCAGQDGQRPVGYAVQRAGDVAGEHTVGFFGPGERLELTHRAHDRGLFAHGALYAAQWLTNKAPGFYSMRDVLGLRRDFFHH